MHKESRISAADKTVVLSVDKSSNKCLNFGFSSRRILVPYFLAAAIVTGTILCHMRIPFTPLINSIAGPTSDVSQVNRSHKGVSSDQHDHAECTTGCLVTGEEWYSVLQDTNKVAMASYNITEQSIQAFQAVSNIYTIFSGTWLYTLWWRVMLIYCALVDLWLSGLCASGCCKMIRPSETEFSQFFISLCCYWATQSLPLPSSPTLQTTLHP